MMIVVSPAKTLDYESPLPNVRATQPRMLEDSEVLVKDLRKLSAADLSSLMSISDKLGELNRARFKAWSQPFDSNNARPAVFAFKGDVYTGLDIGRFDKPELQQAQKRLRILSGLYGLLRPMDLMQPYRLEMGTRFANKVGKDLYAYWGDRIAGQLKKDMKKEGTDVLVNLASNEYFKALDKQSLEGIRVVTPVFQDEKGGKFKIVSFYAKKARGLMAAWILQNQVADVEGLTGFREAGYRFSAKDSQGDTLAFRRKEKDVP